MGVGGPSNKIRPPLSPKKTILVINIVAKGVICAVHYPLTLPTRQSTLVLKVSVLYGWQSLEKKTGS